MDAFKALLIEKGNIIMKQAIITVNLYSFDELSEDAKQYAIDDHRRFLLDIMRPEDFISGDPEYDTPEMLRDAYNSEYDYYEKNDDPIIESIEANEYLFYKSGELAHTTYFYAGPREGEEVLHYQGKEYRIV